MDEHVAPRRERGDLELLTLEVRAVVVAPADRDALADRQQPGCALAAAFAERGVGWPAREARARPGSGRRGRSRSCGRARPDAVGGAQLVAHEAEHVPVRVVGRADVAEPRAEGNGSSRAVAAQDLLPERHVSCPTLGRRPSTISGPVPVFAAADSKPRKNRGAPVFRPSARSARRGPPGRGSAAGRRRRRDLPRRSTRPPSRDDQQNDGAHQQCEPTWALDSHRDMVPCPSAVLGICKETKEAGGRWQRRSAHAPPSRHHRGRRSRRSRRSDGARRGRARSRDRGAAGVAALEGDVLRQDRRARRADDGEGPARVPARRRAARHRGAGASNARRARRARPTARRAPRARPGHLRLGRLVAPVPPRPRGAPPAARRRRSLRRVDEGGARPLPAHPPPRGRRDRRPGDADGLRARPAHAGAGEADGDDPVDDQLRRARPATRSRRSPRSTRRPCARSPPPTTSRP